MVPLRSEGSDSQDNYLIKEVITMISVNTLRVEENKLYGTIKWVIDYANVSVKLVFEGLYKEDLSEVFKRDLDIIDDPVVSEDIIIDEGDHKIFISKRISELRFTQALVEMFAAAFKA